MLLFNTHSQTTRDGAYHESVYDGELDAFIVRSPEDNRRYWVGIEHAPSRKMCLRLSAAIDHPAINWADQFVFGGEIPD